LTTTLKETGAPAATLEPDVAESETKAGAPLCSTADQLSALPPVLVRLTADEVAAGTLMVILEVVVPSTGGGGATT
jgi:hypothetical protein